MKNKSRLLLFIFLVLASASSCAAKSLNYNEAKLRTGLLFLRSTQYFMVCNAVLDGKMTIKTNLHCTYGEHEYDSQRQTLVKTSSDQLEDAFFVIGKDRVRIPNDDWEYEELMESPNSIKVNMNRYQSSKKSVKLNDDVLELKLRKWVKVFGNDEKISLGSHNTNKLKLLGFIEDNGYMVRIEENIKVRSSSTGGYFYNLRFEDIRQTSGAPIFCNHNQKFYLCALQNAESTTSQGLKHAVRLIH